MTSLVYFIYLLIHSSFFFTPVISGFRKVCGGDALDLFEPPELELLICGNPILNFVDLQRGSTYEV